MLTLANARIVNVFTSEVIEGNVVVDGAVITAVGDVEPNGEVIDCAGRFILPGLIDGHIHVESSMLAPPQFANAVAPRGTTATVSDPHEIANVLGAIGIEYMLRSSEGLPVTIFLMAPSCVPATAMETAGAALEAEDIVSLLSHHRVIGVAEMMNYPGVCAGDESVFAKLSAGMRAERPIDGHAPGLTGAPLQRYLAAGIESDHECGSLEEAREKLRLGMHILIRQGSAARNLESLAPLVDDDNYPNFSLVCDDRHPDDLLRRGHMDDVLRDAVAAGLPPVRAIQMATINTARHYRLRHPASHRRLGGIAPGWHADIAVVDDLTDFRVSLVVKDGRLTVRDGALLSPATGEDDPAVADTCRVRQLREDAFAIPARGRRVRVIGVVEDQIVTEGLVETAKVTGGQVVADPARDLAKLASVERHHETGNIGVAFARGFGLQRGALAGSVGHDSHNITVVGADDADMKLAVEAVVAMGGGLVVAAGGRVMAQLPLPVAGLMSAQPLDAVVDELDAVNGAAADLGCALASPFITLSFMPLVVIPHLKLSDLGLVDVDVFQPVELFVDA